MTESYCFKTQNLANIIITYIHIKLSETQKKTKIIYKIYFAYVK